MPSHLTGWHVTILMIIFSLADIHLSQLIHLWQAVIGATRRLSNVGLKLGQRRRRWPNVNPTLDHRLMSAGRVSE